LPALRTHLTRKRALLVVGALALAVGGVSAGVALSSSSSVGDPITVTNVTTSVLENDGLHLTQTDGQPAVSRAAAEQAASTANDGVAVVQSQAAQCNVANADPPVDQVCWVVALDPSSFVPPSNGAPGGSTTDVTYVVSLVDGTTGSVLLTEWGNPTAGCVGTTGC
jgi:hypothetical protein